MAVPRIPKTVQILGHTITVEYDQDLMLNESAYGMAHFNENRIVLQSPGKKVALSIMRQTFYHELTHFMLFYMNNELYMDEKFVDDFGQILHQVMTTASYK